MSVHIAISPCQILTGLVSPINKAVIRHEPQLRAAFGRILLVKMFSGSRQTRNGDEHIALFRPTESLLWDRLSDCFERIYHLSDKKEGLSVCLVGLTRRHGYYAIAA